MKKQFLFFLSIAAATVFYSCNKTENLTSNGTDGPKNDFSDDLSGQFLSRYYFFDSTYPSNPGFSEAQDAEVRFVKSRQQNTLLLADKVFVNSLEMQKDPGNFHTLNSGSNLDMKDSCLWRVESTSVPEIPSFSYNFRMPFPSIKASVPDTIVKKDGITLQIQVAGADSLVIGISGDSTNFEGYIYKSFLPQQGSFNCTFTAKEIGKIRRSEYVGASQAVVVVAYKRAITTVQNKHMSFTKISSHLAGVWVKQK